MNVPAVKQAIVCAFVAVLTSVAALIPAVEEGGGVSALVRLPAEEPLGTRVSELDPDFDFVPPATRYDGLYYYAFALDPLATGEEHDLIDEPAYRYGHVGYGWAAGLMSLGQAGLIPWALLLLSLAGMAAAAGAASLLAGSFGLTPWLGLTVAVNPGLLYAVTSDTSEAFAVGLLGIGLLAWLHDRVALAGAAFVALCLTKEPFVVVPIGLGVWELLRSGVGWRRSAWLAAGPVALAAWFAYLRLTLGEWPFTEGPENLTFPIAGWIETLGFAADLSLNEGGHQVGAAALPLLIATGALLLVGVGRAIRLRSPLDIPYLGLVAVIACLTWFALLFPKDMMRNVAPATYLLPFVLLRPHLHGRGSTKVEDPPTTNERGSDER